MPKMPPTPMIPQATPPAATASPPSTSPESTPMRAHSRPTKKAQDWPPKSDSAAGKQWPPAGGSGGSLAMRSRTLPRNKTGTDNRKAGLMDRSLILANLEQQFGESAPKTDSSSPTMSPKLERSQSKPEANHSPITTSPKLERAHPKPHSSEPAQPSKPFSLVGMNSIYFVMFHC